MISRCRSAVVDLTLAEMEADQNPANTKALVLRAGKNIAAVMLSMMADKMEGGGAE